MQTRKRGGQIVHYSRDKPWHYRWKPLRSHNMDCGPNCFFVLKYADRETCEEMARRTRNGIRPEKIITLLDEAYGKEHNWRIISQKGYDDQYEESDEENFDVTYYFIKSYLNRNDATFASVKYGRFLHYFVVLKDEHGFHAIDAQNGETMRLKDYMDDYTKEFGDCTLSIVVSPLHHREPYKVTMNKIKRYFFSKKEILRHEKTRERTWQKFETATMAEANAESRAYTRKSKSKSKSKSVNSNT
jgi:hypothetical protein